MENVLLKTWKVVLTQKIIFVFVNLVIWVNVVPMCLNIPLRNLINEETWFISWRRTAINEVNDWDLKSGRRCRQMKTCCLVSVIRDCRRNGQIICAKCDTHELLATSDTSISEIIKQNIAGVLSYLY